MGSGTYGVGFRGFSYLLLSKCSALKNLEKILVCVGYKIRSPGQIL